MATPEPTGYSELQALRAWVAEVERVLGLRTRIGLVLLALAAGLGGAALYLALDTRNDAADAGDVASLQRRVQALEQQGGATTTGLRTEVTAARSAADAARAQVSALQKRVGALEQQAARLRAGRGGLVPQGGGSKPRHGNSGATGPTGATGGAGTGGVGK